MATEKLYELAFAYKKTKLWTKLYDSELFALRLPDGETGYCAALGGGSEYIALEVFVGDEGFRSWRAITTAERLEAEEGANPRRYQEYQEAILSQDCLQCIFDTKDMLTPEELEETRLYARDHRISLRGTNAFPHFVRCSPYRCPWRLTTREDEKRLCEALSAAIALSEMLQGHAKRDLDILPVTEDTDTIPLLTRKKGGFVLDVAPLPIDPPVRYPTPEKLDQGMVDRVRGLRRSGILECEVLPLLEAVEDEKPGEAPWYPVLLLCVDTKNHMRLPTQPVIRYQEEPERMLEAFSMALEQKGVCPRAVRVRNEQTRCVLLDFCMACGILLTVDSHLRSLDSAREELHLLPWMGGYDEEDEDGEDEYDDGPYGGYNGYGGGYGSGAYTGYPGGYGNGYTGGGYGGPMGDLDLFQALLNMPDQELRKMPRNLAWQLLELANQGILPRELERRLRRLFR